MVAYGVFVYDKHDRRPKVPPAAHGQVVSDSGGDRGGCDRHCDAKKLL